MSQEICHRNQHKINQIFKQVKVLSDIVDELKSEINILRKISTSRNVNDQNVFFESTRENSKVIDHIESSLLREINTYFRNTGASAKTEETKNQFADNIQPIHASCVKEDCKEKKQRTAIGLSRIYQDLRFLKNKVTKNVQSVRKIQRSSEDYQYICSSSQVYLPQKEAKQEYLEFDLNDITEYTKLCKELNNSSNASFSLDVSTQASIIPCSEQDDDKELCNLFNDEESFNDNHIVCRNLMGNGKQVNPLPAINNNRLVICTNQSPKRRSAKRRVKRTLLSRKKKCSCGEHCPYMLYKLPCNTNIKYRRNMLERKMDNEINGSTLDCSQKRNNFPKFINIDTIHGRKDKRSADRSFEIGTGGSSISSPSVDLDACNNSYLENECSKRKRARMYVAKRINSRKNNKLIKNTLIDNESSLSIISSQRNMSEKWEKIDEAVETMLSQKKYINPEDNYEYEKFVRENFVDSHQSQSKDTKQIQCAISATASHEEIYAKISTMDFYIQQDNIPQCQMTDRMRYTNFPEAISSKSTKFNHMKNVKSSILDDYINRSAKEINENKNKNSASTNIYTNTYVIDTDIPLSESLQSETVEHIYSACHIENINGLAKEYYNEICGLDEQDVQDRVTSMSGSYPSSPPSKSRNFDMNNVTSRLYSYLEKLKKIIT